MKYLAHIAEDGREQTVKEHLKGTALLASEFAAFFGAGKDAELAGMLHDIGKYTNGFQKRLHGGPSVDHSTAGAKEAFAMKNVSVALAVAGHHGGIPDLGMPKDAADMPTFHGRKQKSLESYDAWKEEIGPLQSSPPKWLPHDWISNDFYTRMLYSCLVDADFQDTQNFMDGRIAPRGEGASVSELLEVVRKKADQFLEYTGEDAVIKQRNSVLSACIKSGKEKEPGLFTLTVPTGGGKTFSSLAFALEHAVAHGMRRVIYVIPYTSIIDQTASDFEKLLGKENVLAHYSGVDYQRIEKEDMKPEEYKQLLASENWDAPIIVTTAVQFFESIYSNRSSRCRKLHNIAGSVIIFDEAQTLPNDYLLPCLSAIEQLVKYYHTTAILCTATQPAVNCFLDLKPEEICPDPRSLYQTLKRTMIENLHEISEIELGERLTGYEQVLCVVNRRQTAQDLYKKLPQEGRYCLTTLLCPHDRRKKIDEIRERLRKGYPCRVVSTSLIEAGVDVDFPVAMREDCGLDSLLQTAGRCNRNGKRSAEESKVYRFKLEGKKIPQMLEKGNESLQYIDRKVQKGKIDDISSLAAIEAYFKELYNLKGDESLDKKQILQAIRDYNIAGMLPFAWIAERFHLIESPTKTVYLPIEEGEALCERLRSGDFNRVLMRQLGEYSVECYNTQFQNLEDASALEILPNGSAILIASDKYSRETGLAMNVETGCAIFT